MRDLPEGVMRPVDAGLSLHLFTSTFDKPLHSGRAGLVTLNCTQRRDGRNIRPV